MNDAGLERVERQRRKLEGNVSQLRKSFQHWQTLEVDYEGLKEEITRLPEAATSEIILAIGRDFGAELVDEAELQKLVYKDGGSSRTPDQVVDLLQKRLDYVTRNAQTMERQWKEADKRRDVLAEKSDDGQEAGLPVMDITEELDDDGCVVSSKVKPATAAASQMVDALTQAGVTDVPAQDERGTSSAVEHEAPVLRPAGSRIEVENETPEASPTASKSEESEQKSYHVADISSATKVAETSLETKTGKSSKKADSRQVLFQAAHSDEESSDEEDIGPGNPDDTPEEAALRRQMLQYGMGEVGAIVAELELEEGGDLEYADDDDVSMDHSDEEESEEDNGSVKHPTMSKEYLNKMKQLEAKHGIQSMQNLGPDTSKLPKAVQDGLKGSKEAQTVPKATLEQEASKGYFKPSDSSHPTSKLKKKVAFAEELDIAPRSTTVSSSKTRPTPISVIDPVKSTILERSSDPREVVSPSTTKKPSRFKSTRSSTPQTPLYPPPLPSPLKYPPSQPNPPTNALQSSTIVERTPSTSTPSAPSPSEEIDSSMHAREVANEYYTLRNRLIQRQDGFVAGGAEEDYGEEGEDGKGPLMYRDEEGRERRVSRFLAARLK